MRYKPKQRTNISKIKMEWKHFILWFDILIIKVAKHALLGKTYFRLFFPSWIKITIKGFDVYLKNYLVFVILLFIY